MELPSPQPLAVPRLFYGTAWKEELTESCVFSALQAGFRAIDTANQRKHYFEEAVGRAIARAVRELGLRREELFLQTKFTYARGQDHRKPYDERAAAADQVEQSFASSLRHLGVDFVESYVLHGPSSPTGISETDLEVWSAMERIAARGGTRVLGVSNVSLDQLSELCRKVALRPRFVQNRCFAETRWDRDIREFCRAEGILYQGFSLLTANWKHLGGEIERPADRKAPRLAFPASAPACAPALARLMRETGKSPQQLIFRFAQQLGIIPLIGTRDPEHMRADLLCDGFSLAPEQLRALEDIAL